MPELTVRPARTEDVGAVAAILDECTRHFLDRPSSAADAEARLALCQSERDFLIAESPVGQPHGFGHVWPTPPDEVRCYVRVRPSARGQGISTALLSPLISRAREVADQVALNDGPILTTTSWAADTEAGPLLENLGFTTLRHFFQMRIELRGHEPAEVRWPGGIAVRGYERGDDDRALFASFQESFAEHWGQAGVEETEWWDENRDAANAGFDPELWFIASEGQSICGFSISREREEDGEQIGWVSLLGVPPTWRGRGIGEALLTHSLNAFRSRELGRAALNVDVENTTGALRLYRKVGMEPKPSFTIWSMPLARPAP